ncbi:MAG: DUF2155 domain-containing protein [Pseudoruegeria sp.]
MKNLSCTLCLGLCLAATGSFGQTFGLLPEEQEGANPNGQIVDRDLDTGALGLVIDQTLQLIEIDERERVTAATGGLVRTLDKVDGSRADFALSIGDRADFGRITVTMKECRYPTGNPSGDAYAHVTIFDQTLERDVFDGWMIASAPALSALDHPRYDVWPLRCAIEAPAEPEASTDP